MYLSLYVCILIWCVLVLVCLKDSSRINEPRRKPVCSHVRNLFWSNSKCVTLTAHIKVSWILKQHTIAAVSKVFQMSALHQTSDSCVTHQGGAIFFLEAGKLKSKTQEERFVKVNVCSKHTEKCMNNL